MSWGGLLIFCTRKRERSIRVVRVFLLWEARGEKPRKGVREGFTPPELKADGERIIRGLLVRRYHRPEKGEVAHEESYRKRREKLTSDSKKTAKLDAPRSSEVKDSPAVGNKASLLKGGGRRDVQGKYTEVKGGRKREAFSLGASYHPELTGRSKDRAGG